MVMKKLKQKRKYFEGVRFNAMRRVQWACNIGILLVVPLVFKWIPFELYIMWTTVIISYIIVTIGSERAEFKKITNP